MNERVLTKILQGRSDANIGFNELQSLLLDLGFVERTRGSHRIFRKPGVEDRINIQRDGRQAKPYPNQTDSRYLSETSAWRFT